MGEAPALLVSSQEAPLQPCSWHCQDAMLCLRPCALTMQVADVMDILSMAVLNAKSQHGDGDTRLPQLLAAIVHLQHISPCGAAPPVQPPALPAKTEVRS